MDIEDGEIIEIKEGEILDKDSTSKTKAHEVANSSSGNEQKIKSKWQEPNLKKRFSPTSNNKTYAEAVKSLSTNTNRFACLEIEEGEILENEAEIELQNQIPILKDNTEKEVLVIGDFNVKKLDGPIRQKLIEKSGKVEIKGFHKIRVDALKNKIKTEINSRNKKSLKVIVLAGSNNVQKVESEVLLEKFRTLIKEVKN